MGVKLRIFWIKARPFLNPVLDLIGLAFVVWGVWEFSAIVGKVMVGLGLLALSWHFGDRR